MNLFIALCPFGLGGACHRFETFLWVLETFSLAKGLRPCLPPPSIYHLSSLCLLGPPSRGLLPPLDPAVQTLPRRRIPSLPFGEPRRFGLDRYAAGHVALGRRRIESAIAVRAGDEAGVYRGGIGLEAGGRGWAPPRASEH